MLKQDVMLMSEAKNNISYFSSHEQKISDDVHYLANEFRNNFFRYFGIQNFSPFYDEDLIHFCINMPVENKLHDGYTRKILRDFLSEYLPEDHVNRDKSILTSGLLSNFTIADLQIVKNEFSNINQTLLNYIDIAILKRIISNLDDGNKITEEEIIRLQVFISANTFLNDHRF
jgi:asparagine synthase (glutamine-hydrolysing)